MSRAKKIILCAAILKTVVALLIFFGARWAHTQQVAVRTREFHIPAEPLADALSAYTRETGIDVLYGNTLPAGARSSAVDGTLSYPEALNRLLQGTSLTFRSKSANAVVLEPLPVAGQNVTRLGTLRVEGDTGNAGNGDGSFFGDVDQDGNRSLNEKAVSQPYTNPGSDVFVSREQIDRVPPTTIGDIFKNAPGVIAAGNRNSSGLNINIRGLQGMNRVNVLVDGTQQTNSQYIGYHGNTSSVYIDPDFISGVDISKGPSGGQFGAGAMGGVVNMRTLDATDVVLPGKRYGLRLRGGIASGTREPQLLVQFPRTGLPQGFNSDALRGSVGVGAILDRWNIVLGFARRKTGNYFAGSQIHANEIGTSPGPGGETGTIYSPIAPQLEVFNTSQDELSALTKVRRQFGNGQSIELGYTNYYDKHGELNDYFLIYSGLLPTYQGDLAVTRTHTGSVRYGYFPENSKWVHFRTNIWGTRLQTRHSPQYQNTGVSSESYNLNYPVTSVGTEIWNTSELPTQAGTVNLKYGATFSQENATGQVPLQNGYPLGDPSGKRYLGSLFSQANYRWKPWLRLDGTLRVDRYHAQGHNFYASLPTKDATRVNPTVAVTLEPWRGIQFFGTYARGWRPPSLRETYWQFTTLVLPNPTLRPEKSNNFEVGMNVSRNSVFLPKDQALFKFAYFANRYDDYIGRQSIAGTGSLPYSFTNIHKAKYQGIEAQGQYGVPQLFVQGGYTKYTYITYCLLNQPCSGAAIVNDYGGGYVPPSYTGNGTLGTSLFHQSLNGGFTMNYWSGRAPIAAPQGSSTSNPYVPPVSWPKAIILNGYLSFRAARHYEFGASAENIADRYYLDPLSIAYLPSPGRIVRLNATIHF